MDDALVKDGIYRGYLMLKSDESCVSLKILIECLLESVVQAVKGENNH